MPKRWTAGAFACALLLCGHASAAFIYVSNAGGNKVTYLNAGGGNSPTLVSGISVPSGMAFDPAGNLYIAESSASQIRKYTPGGVLSVFASVPRPSPMAYDSNTDTMCVGGFDNGIIYKLAMSGIATPFATVPANPRKIVIGAGGSLYVSIGSDNTIRKIDPDGTVSTFASGFTQPNGLAFDPAGNLYVANTGGSGSSFINKVTPGGSVSTVASGGFMIAITDLLLDPAGNLYVASPNANNSAVIKITPSGTQSIWGLGNMFTPSALVFVPEPGSMTLIAIVFGGAQLARRRRR